MRKILLHLAVAVCAASTLYASAPVRARQLGAATLVGVVRDPNGAVIPGAAVSATNAATGATRETKTNEGGAYVLPTLPPGEYEMRAEAQGFEVSLHRKIVLQVGQS